MKKIIIFSIITLFLCEKNPVNKDYSYLKFIIYSYLNAKNNPSNNIYIAQLNNFNYGETYNIKLKIFINDSMVINQSILTNYTYKKIPIEYNFKPSTTYNIRIIADDTLSSLINVYIPKNTDFSIEKTNDTLQFKWSKQNKITGYIIRAYFYDKIQNISVPIKKYTITEETDDYITYTESELTGIITDTFYNMQYSTIENFKKFYYSMYYRMEIDSIRQIIFYLYSLTDPTLKYITVDQFSDNFFSAKVFNFDYMNLKGDLKGFIGGIAKDTLIYKIME